MGQVDGNLVQSAWSCYATYSQSTDNTSSTISITAGMRSHGYGMSLNGFWVGIDQGGYSKSSTETSFYSSTGGWVDKDLLNYTDTWTRTHEDRTITCWAAIDRSDAGYRPGKSTAWMTFTVPAKDHWTIAYDATGGSGAPGSQTKWRDENLTLSSTKPMRTGYTFQGWATSDGGAVAYQPGASYTSNDALTLYAVWKANTWTVKFDANGGSGAPASQTKTYGIDLTLSSTKPTRQLYNFLGWGTSSNSSAVYQPGGKYTANADITLYAVWELAWVAPILSSPQCFRSNQNGVADDTGTYAHLSGDWVTDRAVKSIVATVNGVSTTISGTGKAGTISVTLGDGQLSAEQSWVVSLVITDEIGSNTWTWTISKTHYILDFAPNGSIGVNTVADGGQLGMTVDMPINGLNKKTVRVSSGTKDITWCKVGTWHDPISKNVVEFTIYNTQYKQVYKGVIYHNYVDSTSTLSENTFWLKVNSSNGNDAAYTTVALNTIDLHTTELWLVDVPDWFEGTITVEWQCGTFDLNPTWYTEDKRSGIAGLVMYQPFEFSVGSGLALSDRGVLSIPLESYKLANAAVDGGDGLWFHKYGRIGFVTADFVNSSTNAKTYKLPNNYKPLKQTLGYLYIRGVSGSSGQILVETDGTVNTWIESSSNYCSGEVVFILA
nr:MAG TPA: tail protein [Caudoviricetes sp.]